VDASDGKILWKYDYASLRPEKGLEIWPGAPFTNTITPLYHEGKIYITGGYEHVGAMFKLDDNGSAIHLLWIDSTLDCHHGGVVLVNGYIYGSNWISNASGNWCCIDWETGKTRYEEKWFTKGSIITADGMLYCYEEKNGNIGLVRATPEKFDLISRFRISEGRGPHWSHPVIGEGILYIRHGEVLMAFDLRNN
jgi:outer membrane protein assembly factor BamB